jgi:hypothetical protein
MRLFLLFALLLTVPGAAFSTTLTFNEFGTAPLIGVNGFYTQGVTFSFASGAFYNQSIGTAGNALLSVDPVLSGPTSGELTVTFDNATPILQFDILLLSISTIDNSSQDGNGGPAYSVLLSNGLRFNRGTTPQVANGYSEGAFAYSGAPITDATISFFNGTDANGMRVTAFGVDNFTYVAPEPASFFGLASGLVALGMIRRPQPRGKRNG